MKRPEFTLADTGSFFAVLIFDKYVIKVPRDQGVDRARLERMARVQNELAQTIPGILPCDLVSDCIVMARVPGERCDKLSKELKTRANELAAQMAKQISALGYSTAEMGKRNMFYDAQRDAIYFIDFHNI